MSKYLSRNPGICFSKPKEPHFFSIIMEENPCADVVKDYAQRFFVHCTAAHQAIMEGSVSYLYFPGVIQRILDVNPRAKFVVMVRNPMDMVYSYHARLLAVLEEDEADFRKAWELQAERAAGRRLPKRCHHPTLLQYTEAGMMGRQVEQLFRLAGRNNCLVIVHDDFVADTLGAYKQVLDFIGVDYDGRTEFPRAEANKTIKWRWLQRVLKRPGKHKGRFSATLEKQQQRKKKKKKTGMRLRKWLIKRNTVELKRPPMEPAMRHLLARTYADDIALLGRLLQRDLGHWLTAAR